MENRDSVTVDIGGRIVAFQGAIALDENLEPVPPGVEPATLYVPIKNPNFDPLAPDPNIDESDFEDLAPNDVAPTADPNLNALTDCTPPLTPHPAELENRTFGDVLNDLQSRFEDADIKAMVDDIAAYVEGNFANEQEAETAMKKAAKALRMKVETSRLEASKPNAETASDIHETSMPVSAFDENFIHSQRILPSPDDIMAGVLKLTTEEFQILLDHIDEHLNAFRGTYVAVPLPDMVKVEHVQMASFVYSRAGWKIDYVQRSVHDEYLIFSDSRANGQNQTSNGVNPFV